MCVEPTTHGRRRQRRSRGGGSEGQFPGKLHDLLTYAEDHNLSSVISWMNHGRAFMVHDPERLVTDVLPEFFGQTKYRSFRRQLNMWHFRRENQVFSHPNFVRGNRELCKYMSRQDMTNAAGPSSAPPIVPAAQQNRVSLSYAPMVDWQRANPMAQSSHMSVDVTVSAPSDHERRSQMIPPPFSHNTSYGSFDRYQNPTTNHPSSYEQYVEGLYQRPPRLELHRSQRQGVVYEVNAIRLTESPVMASSPNDSLLPGNLSVADLNDGDALSFRGRQFYFLDSTTTATTTHMDDQDDGGEYIQKPKSVINTPGGKEEKIDEDAFAQAAPMIVSTLLMEPVNGEDFVSLFGPP